MIWDLVFGLGMFALFIALIIGGIIYNHYQRKDVERWLEEKGDSSQDQIRKGTVQDFSHPNIERIDLKRFTRGRISLYRMRVHLQMNSNVTFELTPKSNPQGKVFEPGEGETGIKVVDQYFFTETPDMKGTRRVLKAPIVRKTITKLFEIDPIALVSEEIHSIHVMGDEIEIVFGCSNKYLEPIYEFVVALTEELVE